jgi:uncharacterized protein YlaN (UPF0358 family)
MKPHQARVVQEKKDLDEKITKLKEFMTDNEIFEAVAIYERILLQTQLYHMENYRFSLQARLNLWEDLAKK